MRLAMHWPRLVVQWARRSITSLENKLGAPSMDFELAATSIGPPKSKAQYKLSINGLLIHAFVKYQILVKRQSLLTDSPFRRRAQHPRPFLESRLACLAVLEFLPVGLECPVL